MEKPTILMCLKFLNMYIKNHGIPRSIGLDQAKCLVANQVKTFCNRNNIEIIDAPIDGHRVIGLEKTLVQTTQNKLLCINEEKSANNSYKIRHSIKFNIHQMRICNQKTTKTSPFEAYCGKRNRKTC